MPDPDALRSDELLSLENRLGPAHRDLIPCLVQLAWELRSADRFDEAHACYRRALDILEGGPLRNRSLEAEILFHLGRLLYEKEDFDRSEETLLRSIELRREHSPADAVDLGWALQFLAETRVAKDSYVEAEAPLTEALALFRSVHGRDHVDVGMAHNWLGLVCQELGRFPEAETHYREVIRIMEDVLGPGRALVEVLEPLRTVLEAQGKLDAAGQVGTWIAKERRAL